MFRKKSQLTREQSLSARPIQNKAVQVSRDDTGLICISIPRRKAWWVDLLARVFFVPGEKRVGLDEIGSYVWDLCDGTNDVRSIIAQFQKRYQLNRKEAEVSLTTFLRTLAARRLVVIAVLKGKKSPREKT